MTEETFNKAGKKPNIIKGAPIGNKRTVDIKTWYPAWKNVGNQGFIIR